MGPGGDGSEEGRWICFAKGCWLFFFFWQWGLIVSADSPGTAWWLSRDNCDFSQYLHLCFKPRFESVVVTSLLYIAYYEEQKLSHLFCLTSCFEYFGSSFAVSMASYKAEEKN